MILKNIMSKEVAYLNSEDSIEKAAQLMKQYDVDSIPICSQKKFIGIVTDKDITFKTVATGRDLRQQKVSDIMTSDPVIGSPNMEIHDASKLMNEKQIRRLPIVENNKLVGIVEFGDISFETTFKDKAEKGFKDMSQL